MGVAVAVQLIQCLVVVAVLALQPLEYKTRVMREIWAAYFQVGVEVEQIAYSADNKHNRQGRRTNKLAVCLQAQVICSQAALLMVEITDEALRIGDVAGKRNQYEIN